MPAGPGQIIGATVSGTNNAPFIADVTSAGELKVKVAGDIIISGVEIDSVLGSVALTDNSAIDSNNCTTSTLGAGGSFVGSATNVLGWNNLTVQVFADESSASDGMKFEFSTDGTNWDKSHLFNLTSGTTTSVRRFQFPVHTQFFRNNYTNGASSQGAFRMQTILHKSNVLTSIHRLNEDLVSDNSAQLVMSTLNAVKPNGDFTSIDATAGGNLKVSVEDWNGAVGSFVEFELSPIDTNRNNPAFSFEYIVSGTSTGVTGSRIGSIVQFIGAGSVVNSLQYANDRISTVGSWI